VSDNLITYAYVKRKHKNAYVSIKYGYNYLSVGVNPNTLTYIHITVTYAQSTHIQYVNTKMQTSTQKTLIYMYNICKYVHKYMQAHTQYMPVNTEIWIDSLAAPFRLSRPEATMHQCPANVFSIDIQYMYSFLHL